MASGRATIAVSNVPVTAVASELFKFFECAMGAGSVFACEIASEHKNWKSKGSGRVQFERAEAAAQAVALSTSRKLIFQQAYLNASLCLDDIILRPIEPQNRVSGGNLMLGVLSDESCLSVIECLVIVKAEIMPEQQRVDFWVTQCNECYKLVIPFADLTATFECGVDGGKSNAIVLQLKYGPRIYHKIYGRTATPKFSHDRYHVCKEDYQFIWIRTTDFSPLKSIGQSTHLCWKLADGLSASKLLTTFPYSQELRILNIEQFKPLSSLSELVPVLDGQYCTSLPYEMLFHLNSLVHTQKLVLPALNPSLLNLLSCLTEKTTNSIFQKLHKLNTTCYQPVHFILNEIHQFQQSQKRPLDSVFMFDKNLMFCRRVLVTPSKIYFIGPEVETSNYVIQHFAAHASDFIRVSFVEEDWTKLLSHAVSTRIDHDLLSKPYRTQIYKRIFSILENGIVIGCKRFEFLAFSASQLRANSVWMFASSKSLSAAKIREWMGAFNKIHCVSKCAARMGQLFSSSTQTFSVPAQDVEIIPDIVVITDGIKYCFSDGIGKISLSFARQVAQKVGLQKTPSAFQIRYGGYKGVISVDRTSFWKLSLRQSMLKFDSKNTMLCVTKWSESMPCYLNREIISLLSTLGIKDEVFEAMQREHMRLLEDMLCNREAALYVLENTMGSNSSSLLVNMLLHGYEPNAEPYLCMMLRAHREYQLSDLRSKCRIFIQKGRVLLGCLDETGSLSYGQVFVRVTMRTTEQEGSGQSKSFFQKVDETTSVVVGKVVLTKNPCLHPGDIRVLEAVNEPSLQEFGLVDCVVFPQKGKRPHPNECSGGDLDGDLFFVCWDDILIPPNTDSPMDYIGRRSRIMDHEVSLQEIYNFFIDYMINDTLGIIATAHLVYSDREPLKARSSKCLQLAQLHSMAVDFAKTGAPAEMPNALRPKEYPDFLEREDSSTYESPGILGKLYRAIVNLSRDHNHSFHLSREGLQASYDSDLQVAGFEEFLEIAVEYKKIYAEKLTSLMNFYGAETEDEILTGNLRKRSNYMEKDRKKYAEIKDRMLAGIRALEKEARGWIVNACQDHEQARMSSAWYHVTYHPNYYDEQNFLSFPWCLSDILLDIKSVKYNKR